MKFDGCDLLLAMFFSVVVTFMLTLSIMGQAYREDLQRRGLIQYVIDSKTGVFGIQFLSEKDGVWAFHDKDEKEKVKKD